MDTTMLSRECVTWVIVKNKPHRLAGFTLIELMIVIAIVAILVALAVPAYQAYAVRAKVTECIASAAVPKLQIEEYAQAEGKWPESASQAGVNVFEDWGGQDHSQYCHLTFDISEYISSRDINSNTPSVNLVIWVNTDLLFADSSGRQIAPFLTPTNINGRGWKCTVGWTFANEVKYLPSQCRTANVN